MELLRTLTIVYAGVLVVALAVSLTLILVYLRRIAAKLSDIRSNLATVAQRTEPLEGHFEAIDADVARVENDAIQISLHAAAVADVFKGQSTLAGKNKG